MLLHSWLNNLPFNIIKDFQMRYYKHSLGSGGYKTAAGQSWRSGKIALRLACETFLLHKYVSHVTCEAIHFGLSNLTFGRFVAPWAAKMSSTSIESAQWYWMVRYLLKSVAALFRSLITARSNPIYLHTACCVCIL